MECYPYYYTVTGVSHTQLGQLRFHYQLKPSLLRNARLMREYFPSLRGTIIDSIPVYLRGVIFLAPPNPPMWAAGPCLRRKHQNIWSK